ncbi:MAG TPA: hypothetical protein VHO25_15830 [Polyangiaceae bacterium]|nr:hypothetical protein [Polyangiaceae bacterium]
MAKIAANQIAQYATVIDGTGAPLTLTNAHDGYIVGVDADVTVPPGLVKGFNCLLIQIGADPVEIIASGTIIHHRQDHAHIAGQWGMVTVASYAEDVFVLGGDTDT